MRTSKRDAAGSRLLRGPFDIQSDSRTFRLAAISVTNQTLIYAAIGCYFGHEIPSSCEGISWQYSVMIPRLQHSVALKTALDRNPVVLLVGARQCGKTTLARQLVSEDSINYFDLENPVGLARLDQTMTALQPLRGLVVIDEVQRRPDLFPVLRVLADRRDAAARFQT